MTIGRVVFAHGKTFHDGGWFDASAGKPQVQIQAAKGGPWQTVGELTDYPATTATDSAKLADGARFTCKLPAPVQALAVRVTGKPAHGDAHGASVFFVCRPLGDGTVTRGLAQRVTRLCVTPRIAHGPPVRPSWRETFHLPRTAGARTWIFHNSRTSLGVEYAHCLAHIRTEGQLWANCLSSQMPTGIRRLDLPFARSALRTMTFCLTTKKSSPKCGLKVPQL